MSKITRRDFLKNGAMAAGAAATIAPHSRVLGANNDIRIAVVGFRSQGRTHLRYLRELEGVRVVALCDPDENVLNRELNTAQQRGEKVEGYADIRKLLENKSIDAITTATPDHWHALVTVWACQAGKDVYVEKPLCHHLWEGRKIVEAAEKYDRIVQFGNQDHGHPTGEMHLEIEGKGKILLAYTSLNRMRKSIGKVDGPQAVPKSLDYNLWTGPAPLEPLMRKNLHYDWHWVWPTGTGEIGNNGIYPLDALRLSLGLNTLPRRALSFGGRYLFNDDGETANTQIAIYEYDPGPMVIFELRNLPSDAGPKTGGRRLKCEGGTAGFPGWKGPEGDRGGFKAHKGHLFNFLKAVRSRKVSDQRAPVIEGHLSTALVHMANASYRVGESMKPDAVREAIKDRGSDAVETFDRFKEHLAANGVDWSTGEVILGPWLEMDREKQVFRGNSDEVARANQILRGHYREPFVIPEKV